MKTPPAGPRTATSHHPLQPVRRPENLQRKAVGEMLREWENADASKTYGTHKTVVPSHLLDGSLYDFKNAGPPA